jgi:hypothetical protein
MDFGTQTLCRVRYIKRGKKLPSFMKHKVASSSAFLSKEHGTKTREHARIPKSYLAAPAKKNTSI